MKRKPTQPRGGKRKGAGRPRLADTERPIALTVRVRRPVLAKFEEYRYHHGLSQSRAFSELVESAATLS